MPHFLVHRLHQLSVNGITLNHQHVYRITRMLLHVHPRARATREQDTDKTGSHSSKQGNVKYSMLHQVSRGFKRLKVKNGIKTFTWISLFERSKGSCYFVKQSGELTIQEELLHCSAFFTPLLSLELIHLPSLSFPCVQVPQILSPSAVIIETPTPYSLSLTNTYTCRRHCPLV